MNFIKTNWILLLVLTLVIVFAYKAWKIYKLKKDQSSTINTISNNINTTKSETTVNKQVDAPIILNTNPISFNIGDKLYAGKSGANTYKTALISTSNTIRNYSSDSYIGTFLGIQNNFIKVIVEEIGEPISFLFTGTTNTVEFIPNTNQVYKK